MNEARQEHDGNLSAATIAQLSDRAFDATGDGLALIAPDGTVLRCNPAMGRMVGLPPEAMVGRKCWEAVHDAAEPPADCPYARMRESRRRESTRVRLGERWFETAVDPIFASDGTLSAAIHIMTDVTERTAVEESVRTSAVRFNNIFENSPDAIFVEDLVGNVLDANPAACSLHGMAREELLGKNVVDLVPPQMRNAVREEYPKWSSGARDACESFSYTKGGDAVPVEIRGCPITHMGKPAVLLHVRDITERKRAAEALRDSEERLALALQGTRAGLWDWYVQTGETVFDERWAEIVGYDLKDLQPVNLQTWIDLCHPDDLEESNRKLEACFKREMDVYDCECRMKHKDGHWVWVNDRGKVVSWTEDGKPERMTGTHVDITARKVAEQERDENRRMAETLMGNLPGMAYRCRNACGWPMEFISKGCRTLTGYESSELTGEGAPAYGDLIVEEDRQEVGATVQDALKADRPFTMEYRIKTHDGTEKWVWEQGQGVATTADGTAILEGFISDITDRKRAEEALKDAGVRFRSMFENMGSAVAVYKAVEDGSDFVFADFNPAAERIEQIARDEVIGRRVTTVFPAVKEMGLFEVFQRVWRTGEPEHFPVSFYRDGRIEGWRDNYIYRLPTRELVAVYDDRTVEKQAEAALRESEARLRLAIDSSHLGLWDWDLQTNEVYFSPEWKRQIGYRDDEIPNRFDEWQNRVHPDDLAATLKTIEVSCDDPHGHYEAEFRFRHKDGSYRWIYTRSDILRDAEKPLRMLGCHIDITERKQAEEERERLMAAIEQAAETIMITDTEGMIRYVNPAFERITGYTRDGAIGQNASILESGEHDVAFYEEMWATLERGEIWHGRFVNRKKDGTLYTEEAVISPVRDASGEAISYVAVKRDVTDEIKLEAQLRQSQKLESIGTLASGVAHEINNPIMGIMNYAQLILDRLGPESPVSELAVEIGNEGERVATIVKNLLEFSRDEKQTRSPARMCDIVESTLSLIRAVIRHDQIALGVEVPEDLPKIGCRSQQIQQVLMNLLTNARDALNTKYPGHDENKRIDISATTVEKDGVLYLRTTVTDSGPGITADVQDRMFDPFFTAKPRDKGTGLGLSISHGIVKDHGGELTVESKIGNGAHFHLDLPVVEKERP
jgi:PAS domain S-box-containing protein